MTLAPPSVSLITGGSRGIGYAIADAMANRGHNLLLVARDANRLLEAKKTITQRNKVDVSTFVADLGTEADVERLADHCIASKCVPDFLVLNAGIFLEGGLINSEPDAYRRTLDVNLHSIYYLVRRLAPHMKAKAKPRIVLIASTAAYEAYPVGALYGVAKWALRGYAINLRKELMSEGIGVTLVAPGGTLTDLWAGETLPPKRLLEPRDIGVLVAALSDLSEQAVVEELIVRPMLGDMHD
jgi:short-subunit dehydrogenase